MPAPRGGSRSPGRPPRAEIVSGGVIRSAVSPAVPTSRPCSSAASRPGAAGRPSSTASSRPAPRTSSNAASKRAPISRTWSSRSSSIASTTAQAAAQRDRVAAEGRGVVAGHEAARRVVGDEQRADRQAVREPLRERERVGPDAARAARRRSRRCGRRRSAPRRRRASRRTRRRARAPARASPSRAAARRPRPAPARGRSRPCRGPTASASVSGVAKRDARDERLERRALRRLAGDRERAHRAPVERALERDELRLRPVALRAHLIAASTASVPELQKKACAPPKRSDSFSARCSIGSVE